MFSSIVTKVSISVSIITFVILIIMISIIMPDNIDSYNNFIQSQAITHQTMPYAISIAGLLLILLCSLISGFISLYSSFRIAGPLYRFSQNLRYSLNSNKMIALRSDDCLQDLSKSIIHAAKQSERHKNKILLQIEQCQKIMQQDESENKSNRLNKALQQLKNIERQAKLGSLE